jgi:protein O-GlcNAc transferase
VLALRPAPVQITYLGFAGTSGARGVVDYIITDQFITPPESQPYYSEQLLSLPHTYQPQVSSMRLLQPLVRHICLFDH